MPLIGNENITKMIKNITCEALLADSPMEEMSLLDGAEVKANKCPICKTNYHLVHDAGFKVCPTCHSMYKVWNNKSYRILNRHGLENLTVNEMILRKFNGYKD